MERSSVLTSSGAQMAARILGLNLSFTRTPLGLAPKITTQTVYYLVCLQEISFFRKDTFSFPFIKMLRPFSVHVVFSSASAEVEMFNLGMVSFTSAVTGFIQL